MSTGTRFGQRPYQLVITGLVGNFLILRLLRLVFPPSLPVGYYWISWKLPVLEVIFKVSASLPVGYYWISWKHYKVVHTIAQISLPYQLVITGLVGNFFSTSYAVFQAAHPTSWLLLD